MIAKKKWVNKNKSKEIVPSDLNIKEIFLNSLSEEAIEYIGDKELELKKQKGKGFKAGLYKDGGKSIESYWDIYINGREKGYIAADIKEYELLSLRYQFRINRKTYQSSPFNKKSKEINLENILFNLLSKKAINDFSGKKMKLKKSQTCVFGGDGKGNYCNEEFYDILLGNKDIGMIVVNYKNSSFESLRYHLKPKERLYKS